MTGKGRAPMLFGMTETCIEIKKHHVKNIKLLGEKIIPALK